MGARKRKPVCDTCRDTHTMTLGEHEVPCTRCPVPCERCRVPLGAYCVNTPCGCACHPKAAAPHDPSEREIQQAIRLAVQGPDIVLWRNNVGHGVLSDGRHIDYGLAVGSADLVGICAGRFFAIEVKAPKGRVTDEQRQWIALVQSKGGFACVVRSVDEALAAVERCRKGEVG